MLQNLARRSAVPQAQPLHLLSKRNIGIHSRERGHRGAGGAWNNAGRGPQFAGRKTNWDFPEKKVQALKTNRPNNFIPRHIQKSPSTSWIFKDRYPTKTLHRLRRSMDKPWSLSQDEYRAIKRNTQKQPLRERALSCKQMMHQLRKEEMMKTETNYPRTIADFKAGDRIAITKTIELGNTMKLETIKGMCIGRHNKMNESSFSILNSKADTVFEMKIPLWSPFLKSVSVIQKGNFKRAKAYHLRDRPVEEFITT